MLTIKKIRQVLETKLPLLDIKKFLYQEFAKPENFETFCRYTLPDAFTKPFAPFHKEIIREFMKDDDSVVAAPRGAGKALSLDSDILTTNGWKKLKSITINDLLIGKDGKKKKILFLHPISEMKLYSFETRDGRKVLCSDEHLWGVKCPSNTKNKLLIKSTKELTLNYKSQRFDKRNGRHYIENRYFIETMKPVEFKRKEYLIDPYTLGSWLGDGHSAGGRFTTADMEVLDYFPYTKTKYSSFFINSTICIN